MALMHALQSRHYYYDSQMRLDTVDSVRARAARVTVQNT